MADVNPGVDRDVADLQRSPGGVILTTVDALVDWSRGQSLWAMPMGTACCAIELIAGSFSKFDFDRLGTFPRPDPRELPFVKEALASIEKGGYAEALTRVGALLAADDVAAAATRTASLVLFTASTAANTR